MPQASEDFPSIPGFVPVRSDDALETADSPSVGTAATVLEDVIASLDMEDTLRSMLLGKIESQHVLPLFYADLRGRLFGITNSNSELQEIRTRLGNVALEHFELHQHIRRVESKVTTLLSKNRVLRRLQQDTTTPGANAGSNSSAASDAASLSAPMRKGAQTPQPPPAIAPQEPQRVALPANTAPMPSLVPSPPTFTEFMATVPQVATHPLSRPRCNTFVANGLRCADARADDGTDGTDDRRNGSAWTVLSRTYAANNVVSAIHGRDLV